MDSSNPPGGVPLHEAAELLGVTVELLRKRAQRKTIPAYKADGRWYVVLDGIRDVQDTTLPGPVLDRTIRPVQDDPSHAPLVVSSAARSQLEAIRDEWLRPLVDRIGELEREAGQLQERVCGVEREREAFQAERDAALAEVERLKAAQDALSGAQEPQHGAPPANTAPDTPSPWWVSWWRRLVGGSL